MKTTKNISILGLGWLGESLADALISAGYTIEGSVVNLEKFQRFEKEKNYKVYRMEMYHYGQIGEFLDFIRNKDVIIINFPPPRTDLVEDVYPLQFETITTHTPKTQKVIFVSSTSVYGNTNKIENEESDSIPEKKSGKAILKVEALLKNHFGENLSILRFSGLIGENRHPGRFLKPGRIFDNPTIPVNLIHREDCIGLIKRIIDQDYFGHTINGCAPFHPERKTFYTLASKDLGVAQPTFEDTGNNSFKIVDNTKSVTELGYTYKVDSVEKLFCDKALGTSDK